MKEKKSNSNRSPMALWIFGAVVFSFMLSFFLGQGGMLRLRELKAEFERMQLENYNLAMKNRDMMLEIHNLQSNPATIEKIAREELHYVSPHDLVLLVPEDKSLAPRSINQQPSLP
jgi:cell division protein FtsB